MAMVCLVGIAYTAQHLRGPSDIDILPELILTTEFRIRTHSLVAVDSESECYRQLCPRAMDIARRIGQLIIIINN